MAKKTLNGRVRRGCGDAKNWGIEKIREVTGHERLQRGTLNIEVTAPHILRSDFHLPREQRSDGRDEDLDFERCWVVGPGRVRVPALVARTSTNFWKPKVLEVMAEEILKERLGLTEGSQIDIEVWVGPAAAAEAAAEATAGIVGDEL